MKKILVVINTLGQAGAETALLELLRHLSPEEYGVSLYVLMGQGELVHELPAHVKLLNRKYSELSVLTDEGKKQMQKTVLYALFHRGTVFKLFPYLLKNLLAMLKNKKVMPDKLLWRVLSDGGERFDTRYDLAIAYIEGGSTYYVADHVNADKKVAFYHTNYKRAGYTRALDKDCYLKFDKIFAVSDEVKNDFLSVYPECEQRTDIFHNMLNTEGIKKKAENGTGFTDDFGGVRILTIGRLTEAKALDVSIDAMKLLKDAGVRVRWYVLGEGDRRLVLEEQIKKLQLEADFILLGAVKNPYPYLKQTDLYVHASRYEGKSIAIQEAQILGKPILVSDCKGNREQVIPGVDGTMCALDAGEICKSIVEMINDKEKCRRLGIAASQKNFSDNSGLRKLLLLLA